MRMLAYARVVSTLILIAVATPSDAGGRRGDKVYSGNYVIAESEFGNGVVRGRVRETQLGWQVQLPGGSWIYCSNSCTETLRVKTVDFWQSDEGMGADNAITHDGGVFGKLGITLGR